MNEGRFIPELSSVSHVKLSALVRDTLTKFRGAVGPLTAGERDAAGSLFGFGLFDWSAVAQPSRTLLLPLAKVSR